MIIAFIICLGDIDAMIAAWQTLFYPFLVVYSQATNSFAGSTIMASMIVTMGVY